MLYRNVLSFYAKIGADELLLISNVEFEVAVPDL